MSTPTLRSPAIQALEVSLQKGDADLKNGITELPALVHKASNTLLYYPARKTAVFDSLLRLCASGEDSLVCSAPDSASPYEAVEPFFTWLKQALLVSQQDNVFAFSLVGNESPYFVKNGVEKYRACCTLSLGLVSLQLDIEFDHNGYDGRDCCFTALSLIQSNKTIGIDEIFMEKEIPYNGLDYLLCDIVTERFQDWYLAIFDDREEDMIDLDRPEHQPIKALVLQGASLLATRN